MTKDINEPYKFKNCRLRLGRRENAPLVLKALGLRDMQRSIVTLFLFTISFNVLAHGRPDTDGPGSWGLLQDTIKLEQLTLLKTYIHNGKWAAHFSDKFGDEHILFKSSLVGENTGRIININEQGLTIEQVIQNENGRWVTKEIKLKIK